MDCYGKLRLELRRRGRAKKTVLAYVACLKKFDRWYCKELSVARKNDYFRYLDYLHSREYAPKTINLHRNALAFFVKHVLKRRMYFDYPTSKVRKTLPRSLSRREVALLISVIENDVHRLIVELLYSAGLRVSEVVCLRKEDFAKDLSYGWVRNGKGGKDRIFLVAERIKDRLKQRFLEVDDYAFPGRNGSLSARSVQEIVRTAGLRAGIKGVHPHLLRHSFATHLVENDVNIQLIQHLLGHSSSETTFVYVHATPKLNVKSPYDANNL